MPGSTSTIARPQTRSQGKPTKASSVTQKDQPGTSSDVTNNRPLVSSPTQPTNGGCHSVADIIQNDEPNLPVINPEDSISQISRVSMSSSKRATLENNRLLAKVKLNQQQNLLEEKLIQKKREYEDEERQYRLARKQLELDSELQILKAEEDYCSTISRSKVKLNNCLEENKRVQNTYKEPLIEALNALKLPPQQLEIYSGNPLHYCDFVRAFKSLIEDKVSDDTQRLYYLVQHTAGLAKQLVSSCQHMHPSEGYATARNLLQDHFGNPCQIAAAYLNKVANAPAIGPSDTVSLQEYSVMLTSCKNTLESIGYLHYANSPEMLLKIINRLPSSMQNSWRTKADEIMFERHQTVGIQDIADFVVKKTREVTNPIFGIAANHSTRPYMDNSKPRKAGGSSFATNVQVTNPYENSFQNYNCYLCRGNHYLNQCRGFRALCHLKRLEFVNAHYLCHSCLQPGHCASQCFRKDPCLKTDCTARHTTLLHPPDPVNAATMSPTATVRCGFASTGTDNTLNTLLPVIPVKVRAKNSQVCTITNAFLDPGSTSSFCCDFLIHELGVTGPTVKIDTTTVSRRTEIRQAQLINDLEISGLNKNDFVPLAPLFSHDKLPVSKSEIPSSEDVGRWPHLYSVNLSFHDGPVGLLIGSDHPQILQPEELVHSQDGGPYASRTILGWVVNGPNKKSVSSNSLKSISTHSYSVKTDPQILRELCVDNIQSNKLDRKELSVQELNCRNSVETSVTQLKEGHYELIKKNQPDKKGHAENIADTQLKVNNELQTFKTGLPADTAFGLQLCIEKSGLYCRRRWRQIQYMADIFCLRWICKKLPQLQAGQKLTRPSKNFAVNDVVLWWMIVCLVIPGSSDV